MGTHTFCMILWMFSGKRHSIDNIDNIGGTDES
jgi:hypothetical protein